MSTYREGDAERFILMESDDGGLTWHAPGVTESYREADLQKVILLGSADSGTTWIPEQTP